MGLGQSRTDTQLAPVQSDFGAHLSIDTVRRLAVTGDDAFSRNNGRLMVMQGPPTRVVSTLDFGMPGDRFGQWFAWSPDGRTLAASIRQVSLEPHTESQRDNYRPSEATWRREGVTCALFRTVPPVHVSSVPVAYLRSSDTWPCFVDGGSMVLTHAGSRVMHLYQSNQFGTEWRWRERFLLDTGAPASGLALWPCGDGRLTGCFTTQGRILLLRFDPTTGSMSPVFRAQLTNIQSVLAVSAEPEGSRFFVVRENSGAVSVCSVEGEDVTKRYSLTLTGDAVLVAMLVRPQALPVVAIYGSDSKVRFYDGPAEMPASKVWTPERQPVRAMHLLPNGVRDVSVVATSSSFTGSVMHHALVMS